LYFLDTEFVKVDSQGKFLTLWLSQSIPIRDSQSSESATTIPHNHTFLSPPQSASSSSQLISNSITNNDSSIPYQTASTISFDDVLIPSNTTLPDDDDQFWSSLTEPSTQVINENIATTDTDIVSDLYLTLLHSTNKDPSPMKSRTQHDRTVNTLASDILWPLIVDHTKRRNEKKTSSSSTTTTQSISSNSTTGSSTIRRTRLYKQLPSTVKSRRSHPYPTA
jgi:hypothetical protein